MKSIEESILRLFLQQPDQPFSGESLAQSLGLSRTAIWNHIKSLRELGYQIEARPHVGYLLAETPDRFIADEIYARLKTEVIGQNVLSFEAVDSTNDVASSMAEEGSREGTLILAETQRKGRGRLGREWISPKQTGLWSSLILRPEVHPSKVASLTLMAALSMMKAIEKTTGLKAEIKWPNDLYLNGKKVCGILSEMRSEPDQIRYIILGLGVNINLEQDELPKEIEASATSLLIETGKYVSRMDLLCHYLEAFEVYYQNFPNDLGLLLEEVKKNCLTLGKQVSVVVGDQTVTGQAVELDETGALVLEKKDGTTEKIYSGDLSVCS